MPEKEQTTSTCKWSRKTEAGGQVAKLAKLLGSSGMLAEITSDFPMHSCIVTTHTLTK